MQILISDANIIIDLEEGHLLIEMFDLPFNFAIPDILFLEELEEDHAHVIELGLEMYELSPETMANAMGLIQTYNKGPSRNDCFALALAQQEQCTLLTGDRALRAAAENEGVAVKGTLWIVEQMVRQGMLTTQGARNAFTRMKASRRRLPWNVAEAILVAIEQENQN